MDKLDRYRNYIREILEWYAGFEPQTVDEYESQIVVDDEHDHYQLLDVGWDDQSRIHNCVLHLDIKDGKIWVQQDLTDPGVVEKLLDRGVPKEDIVLAFHAPYKRPYTGFAVA